MTLKEIKYDIKKIKYLLENENFSNNIRKRYKFIINK